MNLPEKSQRDVPAITVDEPADLQPPKKDSNDTAQEVGITILKKLVEGIPVVGGIVSELVNHVITPIHEKRMEQWFEKIGTAINELQADIGEIKALRNNEVFVSVFIEASQIAVKTHLDEKREMLSNAVMNSIINPIEYEKEHLFLEIIERLSERHIILLKEIEAAHEANTQFEVKEFKRAMAKKYFDSDFGLMVLYFKQLTDYHFTHEYQSGLREAKEVFWTIDLTDIADEFLLFIKKPNPKAK